MSAQGRVCREWGALQTVMGTRGTQKDWGWMGASSQGRDSNLHICDRIIIRHVEALSCARHSSTVHWSSTIPAGSASLSHFKGEETEAQSPDCLLLEGSEVLGGPWQASAGVQLRLNEMGAQRSHPVP